MAAKGTKSRNSKSKKEDPKKFWIQMIWLATLSIVIVGATIILFVAKVLLPDTSELENPKYDLATQVLSANGEVIGKAFRQNREWLSFHEINPHIINALVATEDERYFSHSGIDARSTLRAVVFLGKRGGASTITQQLAKQFFTDYSRSFVKRVWQKVKEWVIAVEFEKRYTKEEILAMYLNKNEFLHQSIGIATAAQTYFGKNQSKLAVDEAAVLVGMLKNPNLYNPKLFPENANKRRNVVMRQMVRNEFITQEEYKSYAANPINIENFSREVYYRGVAPYFRAELVK